MCIVKEKRILVVAANPLGGIRSYLLYNGRRLLESGYVFTFLSPEGEAFDSFKNDVVSWPGVELLGVPVCGRRFSFWPSVRRAMRSGRFSLIHSQGLRAGTETAFANLGLGLPHVITLHDVIVPQNDVPGRLKWFKKRVAGWLTSRATVIVPVSHDCAENHLRHFPEWKRGRCRVEVILNGVDVEQLERVAETADGNALREQLGFSADVTLLGFFGRFMPQKGFVVLLDALRELARLGCADRVRLVATKDPYGYGREYMHEVAQDDVLSPIVRFIEPVPQIAALLPQIDIVVMPSLWEACPLLPMEAMCLGVPVLGSDCIGLREVLKGTPSRMVQHNDVEALAVALCNAMIAPWTNEAREYAPAAQQRFDVAKAAKTLQDVFDRHIRCGSPFGEPTEAQAVGHP